MNNTAHLLIEDRPEFERILDEALRTAAGTPGAAGSAGTSGSALNSEQLRAMALSAAAAISACAATEYDHYLKARLRQRTARSTEYPTADGSVADTTSGAGLFAIVAVLTPILAGAAALIFLLVGYLLTAMTPEPAIASPLRTAGWLFAAIATAGIVLGTVGLVLTALRDGSSAILASNGDLDDDVTAAKEAWLTALRDHGVLPFLSEAQASSADRTDRRTTDHTVGRPPIHTKPENQRIPHLGYSHPGFSSPGSKEPTDGKQRPRFSSPDFSSPDFGGPDTEPS